VKTNRAIKALEKESALNHILLEAATSVGEKIGHWLIIAHKDELSDRESNATERADRLAQKFIASLKTALPGKTDIHNRALEHMDSVAQKWVEAWKCDNAR